MNGLFMLQMYFLGIIMILGPFWRKSIRDFRGRYLFLTADGKIHTRVEFVPSGLFGTRMRVSGRIPEGYVPDVSLEFRNGKSFYSFLLSGGNDVFHAMLDNRLTISGNMTYMLKFAYMAGHLLHPFHNG